MLKKAGIAAAVAAAGLLALSPFALADTDQDNHQTSFQGEGVEESNGNNIESGLAEQNFGGGCPIFIVGITPPNTPDTTSQESYSGQAGGCTNSSNTQGQVEEQHQRDH